MRSATSDVADAALSVGASPSSARMSTQGVRSRMGAGRASPRDFTTHHAAAISAAIVTADAAAITPAAHSHAARLDAGQGG